jgi:biopolymer transport protein ExbD
MIMASNQARADEAIVGINVTPLVDITLVLLIIFMVTAKMIAGQGVPLDLPKAATAGAAQSVLNVSIDARGNVLVNNEPVQDRAELGRRARELMRGDPNLRALISAATFATHGSVLGVMDGLREAGLTKIAFAADKGDPLQSFGEAPQ